MIAENLERLRSELPRGVRLVCVSKFHPVNELLEAYAAGERIFGESHVQEMVAKRAELPDDVEWHFIGHLQTNKVRQIVPFVSLIHAVDSARLLNEINKEAARVGRVVRCLLEVRVAQEQTKYGFDIDELRLFMRQGEWRSLPYVNLCGLMCMASNTDDERQIAAEFAQVRALFDEIRQEHFASNPGFSVLSMGMSDDWPIAVCHGSNMVRVGTAIFGQRNYDSAR